MVGMRGSSFELLNPVDTETCALCQGLLSQPSGDPMLTQQRAERCGRLIRHPRSFAPHPCNRCAAKRLARTCLLVVSAKQASEQAGCWCSRRGACATLQSTTVPTAEKECPAVIHPDAIRARTGLPRDLRGERSPAASDKRGRAPPGWQPEGSTAHCLPSHSNSGRG